MKWAITKQTAIKSSQMAVMNSTIADGLQLHSGPRIQYANKKFANIIGLLQKYHKKYEP
jgi:hypothetical protein